MEPMCTMASHVKDPLIDPAPKTSRTPWRRTAPPEGLGKPGGDHPGADLAVLDPEPSEMAAVAVLPSISDPDQPRVEQTPEFECGGLRQTSLGGAASFDLRRIDVEEADFGASVPKRVAVNYAGDTLFVLAALRPADLVSQGRDRKSQNDSKGKGQSGAHVPAWRYSGRNS